MHRCVEGLLLALLICSSTACLSPRLASCPAQGGQPWLELESDHFVLQTDLPPDQARQGIEYLERTRSAMLAAAWPAALKLEMPRLTVHVIADPSQFERIFPRRIGGVFSRDGNEPFIVLAGAPDSWDQRFTGLSDSTSSTVKHELAHYLSSYFLLRQPRWLAEGLAQFLETLQLSKDGRTAVIGQPHLHSVSAMKTLLDGVDRGIIDTFSMKDVVTWEGYNEEDADWEITGKYAGSWLLVHWLYNTRVREFSDLQALLAQGEDPQRATRAVFPEFYTRTLNKTLLDYVQHGSYQELTVQVPTEPLASSERGLEDAEVHFIRARISTLAASMAEEGSEERLKLAMGEFDEVLRQDPQGMLALSVKMSGAPDSERLPLARAAVEAHPDEDRAWLMLAQALGKTAYAHDEQEAAYKKALQLAPKSVSASNGLAWFYVTQYRYEEAFPLAQRAVQLAPWSSHVLDTYAVAAAGLGRCPEAILAEQRAIDLLQEHPDAKLEKSLRERLRAFSPAACVPPPLK
jgi:tetratricopeptide (TPR) repeat protein